ncbi:MAG: DUF309 domain-containing protein [Candidatus Thorarchaeota archaeon]
MNNLYPMKTNDSKNEQPSPIDPHWIRYTNIPLPAYAHIPSVTPHPLNDPRGHSYGTLPNNAELITEDSWQTNQIYLYGFDLYNFSYWWEAHETWEGIWQSSEKKAPLGRFLQGLIQLSTVFLKRHQRRIKGVRSLSMKTIRNLDYVNRNIDTAVYLGVDILALLGEFKACIAAFLEDAPSGDPFKDPKPQPLIKLRLDPYMINLKQRSL